MKKAILFVSSSQKNDSDGLRKQVESEGIKYEEVDVTQVRDYPTLSFIPSLIIVDDGKDKDGKDKDPKKVGISETKRFEERDKVVLDTKDMKATLEG
jgi:hypothetical protein